MILSVKVNGGSAATRKGPWHSVWSNRPSCTQTLPSGDWIPHWRQHLGLISHPPQNSGIVITSKWADNAPHPFRGELHAFQVERHGSEL